MVIKPRGYLYSFQDQNSCQVGIQGIPDYLNEYRLGSIFLRNFYVGLDYEFDELVIGLNKNNQDAQIHGKSKNPFDEEPSDSKAWLAIIILLLVLGVVGALCWLRAKKKIQL